ncbi:Hermansky-Pudlak syndrome 1 protein isoform X1 [Tachypleus tridentatus]|uniref:Hermansky-Pudlak syndrome 1 protein isoform X1 n=1 Tax=Tachypleus tridentatus TaxID=6853 RepID=UPI003FCFB7E5
MKGYLIFDNLNDLIFIKTDHSMKKHLQRAAAQNGLVETNDDSGSFDYVCDETGEDTQGDVDISRNVIVQLFSPLVTSQRVMLGQFMNLYTLVECSDGILMAFKEYLGFLFICVGTLKEDTKLILERRLHIFLVSVKLLYGPAVHLLRDDYVGSSRKVMILTEIFDKWDELRLCEQSFLVEAVEKLKVSHSLNASSVKLLQTVLEKVRKNCRVQESACHAFLLVDCKILALYSSRNASELDKSDIFLLILLTQVLQLDKLKEFSSNTGEQKVSTDSASSFQSYSENESDKKTSVSDKSESQVPVEDLGNVPCGIEVTEEICTSSIFTTVTEVRHVLVFLKSHFDTAIPHMVHTVPVLDHLVLVIVGEIKKSTLSHGVTKLLLSLHSLQVRPLESKGCFTMEKLESSIVRIIDSIRKMRLTGEQDFCVRSFLSRWEHVKKNDLMNYMNHSDEKHLPARLDCALSALCNSLQEMFVEFIFKSEVIHENDPSPALMLALQTVQELVRSKLHHYAEYLEVKTRRNLGMTAYLQEFPDLLHFLFLDRANNYLLTPSLETDQENLSGDGVSREVIWNMVDFAYQYLYKGNTSVSWRDDKYFYFFLLWFEDPRGKELKPKPKVIPPLFNLKKLPLPGIVCGDFYRILMKECFPCADIEDIHCYEIFCLYPNTVSNSYVNLQARRLAVSMWEMSGGAVTPLDFL